jgi:hypothetical protein
MPHPIALTGLSSLALRPLSTPLSRFDIVRMPSAGLPGVQRSWGVPRYAAK